MKEKNCTISTYRFAKLTSASDQDGESYDDSRAAGLQGLLLWAKYKDQDRGYARFLFFDSRGRISSITTSDGTMKINKNMVDVRTGHSEYVFMVDDQGRIPPEDRERLLTQAQAYFAAFEGAEKEGN